MAERYIRDESGFTREDFVVVERNRPHPGAWLAVFLLICGLGAGGWLVYQNETSESRPVAVNAGSTTVVTDGPASIREHTYVQDGMGHTRAEHIVDAQVVDSAKLNGDSMSPTYMARRINVVNARVAELVGPGAFTIGPRSHHTILVHYRPIEPGRHLRAGQVVNITGQVKAMPDLVRARRMFGLGTLEGSRLGSVKYYIDAEKVSPR